MVLKCLLALHDDIESVIHLVSGAVLSCCPAVNSVAKMQHFF